LNTRYNQSHQPLLTFSFLDYSYNASQADVAAFKALKSAPDATKYPNAARWYKHIASYEDEFSTLSGDASKPYTAYGPEVAEVTLNPAKAPAKAEEEDEDVDLFGSDDEEEDAEAVRIREERLAEYRKKKEGKVKPAAKSIVTMDIKPWGMLTTSFLPLQLPVLFQSRPARRYQNGTARMLTMTLF
jgi:elongation factor 1-beta